MLPRFLFVLLILVHPMVLAGSAACSKSQAAAAEKVAPSLRTWDALSNAFAKYGSCDDGAVAQGFTESVVRTLVEHWPSLDRLSELSRKNPEFRRFVLKHINESAYLPDLKQVAELSKARCPTNLLGLCDEIHAASETALRRSPR